MYKCLYFQQLSSYLNFSLSGWQAWAVASGKISEFPTDKARWKTNFRCALNNLSVRFKMVQDNSRNSDDPHKIYEIINTGRKCNLTSEPSTVETLRSLNANVSGFVFLWLPDNYESVPIQDSQEDSDMTQDIYCSPTECIPSGAEVKYCLERSFTSLFTPLHFTSLPPFLNCCWHCLCPPNSIICSTISWPWILGTTR